MMQKLDYKVKRFGEKQITPILFKNNVNFIQYLEIQHLENPVYITWTIINDELIGAPSGTMDDGGVFALKIGDIDRNQIENLPDRLHQFLQDDIGLSMELMPDIPDAMGKAFRLHNKKVQLTLEELLTINEWYSLHTALGRRRKKDEDLITRLFREVKDDDTTT